MKPDTTLLNRLQNESTPLIDGNIVTFVWKGKSAPKLKGDFTNWESGSPVSLERIAKGIWTFRTEFPADAYIEYCYFDGVERLPDPHNPRHAPNGVGDTNHYFYMPHASATHLTQTRRGVPHGKVSRFRVPTLGTVAGERRTVYLYQPTTDDPCPLVLVFDGRDYLRRGRLVQIIDNLIDQGRMRPVALAMVDNGGSARMPEYACSESTLAFLMQTVLPLAKEHLKLLEIGAVPGSFGVMGASMGGLMALYTAFRLPRVFSHVLSQSGGFWRGKINSIVFDLVEKWDVLPMNIWMDVGLYDFRDLLESNRYLYDRLQVRGYPVQYREYPGGHNYTSWRDEVWRGLEYLFPISDR